MSSRGRKGPGAGGNPPGLNSLLRNLSTNNIRRRQQSMRGTSTLLASFSAKGGEIEEEEIETMAGISGIIQEKPEDKSDIEILRLRTKAFFAYSWLGRKYDWCLLLLSIISCLSFIYQTYLPDDNTFTLSDQYSGAKVINVRLNQAELTFAAIFSIDFGISLFIADHRWEFLRR